MAKKKLNLNSSPKLSGLNSNFLLSLGLFVSTYIALGWSIGEQTRLWLESLREQNLSWEIAIEEDLLLLLIKLLAVLVTFMVTLLLSSPVALTTFLFEESVGSDLRGLFSILFWSILLVFAFCYFGYFADFLVLVSVNLLLRLDLKRLKYNNWQIILMTSCCAVIAFIGGIKLFDLWLIHSQK